MGVGQNDAGGCCLGRASGRDVRRDETVRCLWERDTPLSLVSFVQNQEDTMKHNTNPKRQRLWLLVWIVAMAAGGGGCLAGSSRDARHRPRHYASSAPGGRYRQTTVTMESGSVRSVRKAKRVTRMFAASAKASARSGAGSPASAPAPTGRTTTGVPAVGPRDRGQEGTNQVMASRSLHRIVIYTASVMVSVVKRPEAVEQVRRLVESKGGYVQSSTEQRVVVRIPAGRFYAFLDALKEVGRVFARRVSSSDVTEQYMDLNLRLKAALSIMGRLKALLAKAKTVKEALIVEREIARVVTLVERLKGQIRYMEQHAALSTVTIAFVTDAQRHHILVKPPRRSPFKWIRRLGIYRLVNMLRVR